MHNHDECCKGDHEHGQCRKGHHEHGQCCGECKGGCHEVFEGVYSKFPYFEKKAVLHSEVNLLVSSDDHIKEGKWMVLFYYPKSFTFVCPTELVGFNEFAKQFDSRNAKLYGASVDSEYSIGAWTKNTPSLNNLSYPIISDLSKSLAADLGILVTEEEVALRATYIVDPNGIVRWQSHYPLEVGRNVEEVLRVLDALQAGGLTPCAWKVGDKTL